MVWTCLDIRNMLRLDPTNTHKQRGATVAVLHLTELSLRQQLCGFLGSQIYPDREGSASTAVGCLQYKGLEDLRLVRQHVVEFLGPQPHYIQNQNHVQALTAAHGEAA